jgi:hypothetical protein
MQLDLVADAHSSIFRPNRIRDWCSVRPHCPMAIAITNRPGAWITLLCGGFVTLVAKLDNLAELSMGPLRAKMRETIAEAAATIDQLRDVATSITSAFLTQLIAGSFMGGMSQRSRFQMHDDLLDQLKSLGVSEERLQQSDAGWRLAVGVIYHSIIETKIMRDATPADSIRQNGIAQAFAKLLDFPNLQASSPEVYERFARDHDVLTPNVQPWIDDYRHFVRTNEIRRLEEFHRRGRTT